MSRKSSASDSVMTRQSAVFLAVMTFALGFFVGVGFAIYNTRSTPPGVTDANPGNDHAQRARALDAEVKAHPENTAAWIQLGHIYFDANQYKKAIRAYESALKLDPENADVWTDLGVMYRRSGDPRKAVEQFDRAVAVDPRHETARFNKGIVLLHDLNDKDGAIRVWEELTDINPLAMAGNNQSVEQLIRHYKEDHDKNKTD